MSYLKKALPYFVIGGVSYLVVLLLMDTRPTRPPGNESSAISSIRNIVTSQITYSDKTGRYAKDLATLLNGGLIDSALGSGTKDGYKFITTSRSRSTFTINATPLRRRKTGYRSFYADETGVIRYTEENRPATADDLPMGQ